MIGINKTSFGYRLTLNGEIAATEMSKYQEILEQVLAGHDGVFNVFADLRNLQLPYEFAMIDILNEYRLYKKEGIKYYYAVMSNPALIMQFKQMAAKADILKYARFIDATKGLDWEAIGLNWVINGIDPDKKTRRKKKVHS